MDRRPDSPAGLSLVRIPLTAIVTFAVLCVCGTQRTDAEAEARSELGMMASTVNRLLTLNLDYAPSCSSLKECMDEIDLCLAALDTVTSLDPVLRDSLSAVYRSLRREAYHELRAVETAIVRTIPPPSTCPPVTAQFRTGTPSPDGESFSGGRVLASFRWVEGPDPSLATEIAETEQQLLMIRSELLAQGSPACRTRYLHDGSWIGPNPDLARDSIDPVVFLEARLDSLRALQEGRSP
jgi:hypothetical protein